MKRRDAMEMFLVNEKMSKKVLVFVVDQQFLDFVVG
jgi:hypothetical protein